MDEGCSDAVLEVFVKLYEKGYIYKGSRIINWCPACQTSISDAEVEHEEKDGAIRDAEGGGSEPGNGADAGTEPMGSISMTKYLLPLVSGVIALVAAACAAALVMERKKR